MVQKPVILMKLILSSKIRFPSVHLLSFSSAFRQSKKEASSEWKALCISKKLSIDYDSSALHGLPDARVPILLNQGEDIPSLSPLV